MSNSFATPWNMALMEYRDFPGKNSGVGNTSSQSRDGTRVPCLAARFFTTEPPGKPLKKNIYTYNWVTLLYTWNNIVNQLYFKKQL